MGGKSSFTTDQTDTTVSHDVLNVPKMQGSAHLKASGIFLSVVAILLLH